MGLRGGSEERKLGGKEIKGAFLRVSDVRQEQVNAGDSKSWGNVDNNKKIVKSGFVHFYFEKKLVFDEK